MSGPAELLLLRLGLILLMFGFLGAIALSMRGGLSGRSMPLPRAEGRLRWKLLVVLPGESGLARGTSFPLAGKMLIGRGAPAGIVIPDSSVSIRHATIERVAGGWQLTDLGSTNGTLVDASVVDAGGTLLRGGEQITVGVVVLQLLAV